MHFPNTKTDYPHGASRLLMMVQTATPVPPPPASIGSFVLLQHAHGGARLPRLLPVTETGLHWWLMLLKFCSRKAV